MYENIFKESLLLEYENYQHSKTTEFNIVPSDFILINLLAHKIIFLPEEYTSLLFFRYCFNMGVSETEKMLEIQNAKGRLFYIKKLLSLAVRLDPKSLISDASLEEACKIALKSYTTYEINTVQPKYSRTFKKQLHEIKVDQHVKKTFLIFARNVAIFLLVCILSFSALIVANAELREKFFNWVVESFPAFSTFAPENEDRTAEALNEIKLQYIPDGFYLSNQLTGMSMTVYEYMNSEGKMISVALQPVSNAISHIDTEGATVIEIPFEDSTALWWESNDGFIYFICQKNGYQCNITAQQNLNELMKIAKGISFN